MLNAWSHLVQTFVWSCQPLLDLRWVRRVGLANPIVCFIQGDRGKRGRFGLKGSKGDQVNECTCLVKSVNSVWIEIILVEQNKLILLIYGVITYLRALTQGIPGLDALPCPIGADGLPACWQVIFHSLTCLLYALLYFPCFASFVALTFWLYVYKIERNLWRGCVVQNQCLFSKTDNPVEPLVCKKLCINLNI